MIPANAFRLIMRKVAKGKRRPLYWNAMSATAQRATRTLEYCQAREDLMTQRLRHHVELAEVYQLGVLAAQCTAWAHSDIPREVHMRRLAAALPGSQTRRVLVHDLDWLDVSQVLPPYALDASDDELNANLQDPYGSGVAPLATHRANEGVLPPMTHREKTRKASMLINRDEDTSPLRSNAPVPASRWGASAACRSSVHTEYRGELMGTHRAMGSQRSMHDDAPGLTSRHLPTATRLPQPKRRSTVNAGSIAPLEGVAEADGPACNASTTLDGQHQVARSHLKRLYQKLLVDDVPHESTGRSTCSKLTLGLRANNLISNQLEMDQDQAMAVFTATLNHEPLCFGATYSVQLWATRLTNPVVQYAYAVISSAGLHLYSWSCMPELLCHCDFALEAPCAILGWQCVTLHAGAVPSGPVAAEPMGEDPQHEAEAPVMPTRSVAVHALVGPPDQRTRVSFFLLTQEGAEMEQRLEDAALAFQRNSESEAKGGLDGRMTANNHKATAVMHESRLSSDIRQISRGVAPSSTPVDPTLERTTSGAIQLVERTVFPSSPIALEKQLSAHVLQRGASRTSRVFI